MDFRIVATGLKFPEGPLELPNGDILVTEIAAGCLTRVRPSGEKSGSCSSESQLVSRTGSPPPRCCTQMSRFCPVARSDA